MKSKQNILVIGNGIDTCHAELFCYEDDVCVFGPIPAWIGKNGMALDPELTARFPQVHTPKKTEGDGRTPIGRYKVKLAFGKDEQFPTKIDYCQMTKEDVWVDDPLSLIYNTLQKKTDIPPGTHYEEMRLESGIYDLGAVIEYNTQKPTAGNGSAIFFHIVNQEKTGSEGCVTVERVWIEIILKWLDSKQSPEFIIAPSGPILDALVRGVGKTKGLN